LARGPKGFFCFTPSGSQQTHEEISTELVKKKELHTSAIIAQFDWENKRRGLSLQVRAFRFL
jgi:hypothetical protein